MKYKKGLIFICLIICLFSIASVCASDVNETVVTSDDQSNGLINDEINNDFSLKGSADVDSKDENIDQENLLQNDFDSNLEDETEYGTFTSLYNMITSSKNVNLTKNYKRADNESDKLFNYADNSYRGPLCIDGQGHIIDSSYGDCVFRFPLNTVTIMNCNFVNAKFAIKCNPDTPKMNINIINCNFTNVDNAIIINSFSTTSSSSNDPYYANVNITNCNFVKNNQSVILEASRYKGYEFISQQLVCKYYIQNCSFIENTASSIHANFNGELYMTCNILDCCFKNNCADTEGGAIKIYADDVESTTLGGGAYALNINNCSFVNNSAPQGGAIYVYSIENIKINKTKFYQNTANKGPSIYVDSYVNYCFNMDKSMLIDNYGARDNGIYLTSSGISNFLRQSYIHDSILFNKKDSNPIIYYSENDLNIDNNWWGNTFDDLTQKPKDFPVNWIVLNVTVNNSNVKIGDSVKIICNLSNIVDFRGIVSNYSFPDFDLSFNLIKENMVIDTINIHNGYGETIYLVNNAQNLLKITLGSFEKVFNMSVDLNTNDTNKTEPEINIPPLNNVSTYETIIITLPNDAKGTVTLIINEEYYPFNIFEGIAKVIVPNLDDGTYLYTITYSGDEKYLQYKTNGSVKINKINVTIKAEDTVVTYGEQIHFTATFFESNGSPLSNKYIVFQINETEYPIKTDSNGVAILSIELNPGEYNVTSINDYSGQSCINKLIVKAPDPKPINDNQIIIPSLSSGSGAVKLPSDAKGTITLDIAGKKYDFPVVNGVANIKLPDLASGSYGYIITYSGDARYTSFSKTGSVTVNKKTTPAKPVTKTTLTLKKVTVKRSAKKLVIQATLKVNSKAVKGKTIKFKFNKKTYNAKTNAKGIAKVTIKKSVLKKLKKGKKVTYTATYGKITKKITVKVK